MTEYVTANVHLYYTVKATGIVDYKTAQHMLRSYIKDVVAYCEKHPHLCKSLASF